MTTTPMTKRLWKNEYFQTAIMIVLIVAVVFGFWFGSRLVLNNQYPALAVASGSMCVLPGSSCDGWSHPFERSLHKGDLIIVQGVGTEDIYAAPFNESGRSGDIIVFRQLSGDELIVHRAVERRVAPDGSISFLTKGDGNDVVDSNLVSADRLIGKVVMRIPWVGHISLYMQNSSGIFIIVILIVIVIIIEFAVPLVTGKKTEANQGKKADVPEA